MSFPALRVIWGAEASGMGCPQPQHNRCPLPVPRCCWDLPNVRLPIPLPPMQGGRAAKDEPILREDILLQRMPHMRPKPAEEADPFAPEYGQDSWHMKHPTTGLQVGTC